MNDLKIEKFEFEEHEPARYGQNPQTFKIIGTNIVIPYPIKYILERVNEVIEKLNQQ